MLTQPSPKIETRIPGSVLEKQYFPSFARLFVSSSSRIQCYLQIYFWGRHNELCGNIYSDEQSVAHPHAYHFLRQELLLSFSIPLGPYKTALVWHFSNLDFNRENFFLGLHGPWNFAIGCWIEFSFGALVLRQTKKLQKKNLQACVGSLSNFNWIAICSVQVAFLPNHNFGEKVSRLIKRVHFWPFYSEKLLLALHAWGPRFSLASLDEKQPKTRDVHRVFFSFGDSDSQENRRKRHTHFFKKTTTKKKKKQIKNMEIWSWRSRYFAATIDVERLGDMSEGGDMSVGGMFQKWIWHRIFLNILFTEQILHLFDANPFAFDPLQKENWSWPQRSLTCLNASSERGTYTEAQFMSVCLRGWVTSKSRGPWVAAPCPEDFFFFQNHAVFRQLWANFGLRPPWGQNSAGPPDHNSGSAPMGWLISGMSWGADQRSCWDSNALTFERWQLLLATAAGYRYMDPRFCSRDKSFTPPPRISTA